MSSIATTNETSNVTSLPTAPKPQTSKEVIAANVKLLIEQLEAGHSEGLTAYVAQHFFDAPTLTADGWFERLTGYVAEQKAASALEAAGHHVTFAATANQPVWDLLVDGHPVQVKEGISGVKSYLLEHHGIPIYTGPRCGRGSEGSYRARVSRYGFLPYPRSNRAVDRWCFRGIRPRISFSNHHPGILKLPRNPASIGREDNDTKSSKERWDGCCGSRGEVLRGKAEGGGEQGGQQQCTTVTFRIIWRSFSELFVAVFGGSW